MCEARVLLSDVDRKDVCVLVCACLHSGMWVNSEGLHFSCDDVLRV